MCREAIGQASETRYSTAGVSTHLSVAAFDFIVPRSLRNNPIWLLWSLPQWLLHVLAEIQTW